MRLRSGGAQIVNQSGSGLSKNPSPEGPALISSHRGGVNLERSNGMMECWNNGILRFKNGIYADFNFCFTC